mmetsp:Transcript_1852/g.5895  ORF Transcript_1852/g.5895 Transcript_1852/m.5895 type:complete len:305 (-) Transcript_1852:519-1433(-)
MNVLAVVRQRNPVRFVLRRKQNSVVLQLRPHNLRSFTIPSRADSSGTPTTARYFLLLHAGGRVQLHRVSTAAQSLRLSSSSLLSSLFFPFAFSFFLLPSSLFSFLFRPLLRIKRFLLLRQRRVIVAIGGVHRASSFTRRRDVWILRDLRHHHRSRLHRTHRFRHHRFRFRNNHSSSSSSSTSSPQEFVERDCRRSRRGLLGITRRSTFKEQVRIVGVHEGVASSRRRLQRCTKSSRIRRTLNRSVSDDNFRNESWGSFASLVPASSHELIIIPIVVVLVVVLVVLESVEHIAHSARSRMSTVVF